MTYQVLARKYRPQRFDEVVGQEHITTTLKNAIASERLHHAYLFTGARGIGKTTVARILAKALNCEKRDGPEPCDKCSPCAEITSGISLDVQEIDGASNTGVDDVRELRERARFLPSSGKYKIYIIDEVHMLSTNAFNALLKTLEEPPKHVIFIFATTEAQKIPTTILSRCQRYDFRRIPVSGIVETLKKIAKDEKVKIGADTLSLIAREATGSLRDAESLFDQAIAFAGDDVSSASIESMLGFLDRKILFELIDAVIKHDAKRALSMLDNVFTSGADLVRFSFDILEMLRHLLVLAECGDARGTIDLPADDVAALKKFGENVQAEVFHQMFSQWYRTAEDVARSPFPKMMLEVGLMRLSRAGEIKSIDEIIARLDELGQAPAVQTQTQVRSQASPSVATTRPPAQSARPQTVSSPAAPSTPTFEPVGSPADTQAEKRWGDFLDFAKQTRPQVESIFQHGTLTGIDGGVVRMTFENPLYADMLSEDARKKQVEELFESFFKRKMRLEAMGNKKTGAQEVPAAIKASEQRKEMVRETLGGDIVRQATDILGAEIHEVKVETRK